MVKLIVEGHAQWAGRYFKCNACEAEFRATPPDYDTVYIGNGKQICFVAECPCCGVDVYTAPEWIKDMRYECISFGGNAVEAVEFIKEFRRYCKAKGTDARYVMMLNSDEEIVRGVMEWSEQNPYKTNLDKLRDVFPDYRESELPCPISVTRDVACGDITRGTSCKVCKKMFWNSEYTEDKK